MKKMALVTMVLLVAGSYAMFGQTNDAKAKSTKQHQAELYNNFYVSYGLGSLFYFINHYDATADHTTGTFQLGYARSLNKVVAVGFLLSYSSIGRSEESDNHSYGNDYKVDDILWQGIANVRFQYLNRPSFCMYSGVGIGVTMDNYKRTYSNNSNPEKKGQNLYPAGQLTLLGFRIGRALSFFGEFGVGTNSIINAGISYKFGDDL